MTDAMLPTGSLFALLVVVVASYIGGCVVSIIRLPALLGMLIVGIILNNVPPIDIARNLDDDSTGKLR